VDVNRLALEYSAALPMWVLEELVEEPDSYESDEQKMALVHRLARRNYREGNGGPFAAIVVDSSTGELVSAGVNVVLASGLSSSHAEVVALSLAQKSVGSWDLGSDDATQRELVVNWRPCAQCYGALIWSGVKRLVIAGDGPELEHLTKFDEGPVRDDWDAQLEARGISLTNDVLRDEAIDVFREYGEVVAAGEVTVYNARGAGALDL
jgi:tRNA(Arg) A34 adenosine deaminase TadA